jgi:hypothetical protein
VTKIVQITEAVARGIDPADVTHPTPVPGLSLPEEHPAPWSCQEELGGRGVPSHFHDDAEVYIDDARRRQVVRNANGGIVVQIVQFSKSEEEKLARFITSIPGRLAEIKKLESLNAKLTEDNHRIPRLEAECSRLRTLLGELCELLLKTNLGQTRSEGDPRIAVAAKLLIDADIKVSELVLVLARTFLDATVSEATSCSAAGIQADGGAA